MKARMQTALVFGAALVGAGLLCDGLWLWYNSDLNEPPSAC